MKCGKKNSTDMQKIYLSGAFKLDNTVPCSASGQNSFSFCILSNLNRAVIESNQEGQNLCSLKKVGVKFDISSYFILFAANNHIHSSSSQRFKVQNGSVTSSTSLHFIQDHSNNNGNICGKTSPASLEEEVDPFESRFAMTPRLILLVVCLLSQLLKEQTVQAFAPSFAAKLRSVATLSSKISIISRRCGVSSSAGDLDGELDKFFELAAESGYENIKNMTPEERVERVIRGEQLENEIFDLRSELMQLEDDMMSGKAGVDIPAVKEMRTKMDKLKAEYKDIVGAKDLPLYFGRLADSLQ